jgi:hypothetical protein
MILHRGASLPAEQKLQIVVTNCKPNFTHNSYLWRLKMDYDTKHWQYNSLRFKAIIQCIFQCIDCFANWRVILRQQNPNLQSRLCETPSCIPKHTSDTRVPSIVRHMTLSRNPSNIILPPKSMSPQLLFSYVFFQFSFVWIPNRPSSFIWSPQLCLKKSRV